MAAMTDSVHSAPDSGSDAAPEPARSDADPGAGPRRRQAAPDKLERLRAVLAQTSEAEPRPLIDLELPFNHDRLIRPQWLAGLRRAAVLAPLLPRPGGHTVLLTRRAETLRAHQGQISFPGGRRDPSDASAVENALREAEEEVGLAPSQVEPLGFLDDVPTLTGYLVTPVVGLVRSIPPQWRIDPGEVAETFEVPLALLLDPASYERKQLLREGFVVPFYEVNFGAHRIWGATAGMLWNLCQKVNR